MNEALATFVNVIIPVPLNKLYTYRVPSELVPLTEPGKRVVVQFGKRKLYAAVINEVHHTPPAAYEAKYLLSLLDEEQPVVSPTTLKFWHWLSSYYMCSLGDVMNAALPAAFRLESTTRVSLSPDADMGIALSDKEFLVIEALTLQKELSVDEISEVISQKNIFPLLKSLHLKGLIFFTEEISETYKPRIVTCIALTATYSEEEQLSALFTRLEKQPKQLNVLLAYMQLRHETEHVERSLLLKRAGAGDSSLKTLIKNGVFETYPLHIDRLLKVEDSQDTFSLDPVQETCYNQIRETFEEKDVCLLHGVTSSGKTHIYVKLIEEVIRQGRQVLYLLPEIALTSQIISRVQKYFGPAAVSFHSRYTQNERVELWKKIQSGEARVVIGARSAIFLPFDQLGLIIVDEEHEQSYKQHEPAPRYHARDAAIFLGHLWQCKTLLGSATPSFESYHNAQTDKYGLVKLKQRYGNVEMPEIIAADLAEENRTRVIKGHFTTTLFHTIEDALKENRQVILFQNRRGYAPLMECRNCSWVPRCINCDISLTYHKFNDTLRCHYCGYNIKPPRICVACGSHDLNLKGLGTEKIEDEINIYFPNARVNRLDLDAAKTKHGHEEIIRSFEHHEADILVGTQMVSKGLDFEHVSAVGVINADQLLFFPDFRAHERAYQLLTQVSGRAGRKNKRGKVIIQTGQPLHHVIREVIHQQYEQFYANEINERREFQYPPFFRLIKISLKHANYQVVHEAAFALKDLLYKRLGDKLIGPESPYVSKIRNLHIKEILVKIDKQNPSLQEIKRFIQECTTRVQAEKAYKGLLVLPDVDPV